MLHYSNSNAPLASVILPAYNASTTIAETIRSVLAQDFEDFEFIIINDGSTDETDRLIRSFDDGRIVYQSLSHSGLVQTLNHGISISRGEYIFRIDADDIAYSDRFSKQITFLQNNPQVGILGAQAVLIDESGIQIGIATKPVGSQTIKTYSRYACPVLHPTYCVQRNVYDSLNGYRNAPSEDYDFLLRALELGIQIENLPDTLLEYRVSRDGITSSNPQMIVQASHAHQHLHALRQSGKDEKHSFEKLCREKYKTTPLFGWLHRKRAQAIQERSTKTGIPRTIYSLKILLYSLGHPLLLLNSYKLDRAGRILKKQRSAEL